VDPVSDGTGDLRAQAAHLGELADRVRKDAGAASVDVIGYSAGGVVARLWVRDGDGGDVARRVLTLGSPQHGTSQAALGAEFAGGCPTACEQLIPDSDLLRRLNAGDETPAGPLWATIRSTTVNDGQRSDARRLRCAVWGAEYRRPGCVSGRYCCARRSSSASRRVGRSRFGAGRWNTGGTRRRPLLIRRRSPER
jgi:Lipase (class 2)